MAVPAASLRPVPVWARFLVVPAVVLFLLVGLWFFGGVVAPGYNSSIALGAAWFVAAAVGLRFVKRRWPELNRFVQLSFLGTAAVVASVFAWTTFRDKTVNETVVTGARSSQVQSGSAGSAENVKLAQGSFEGVAHEASGTAAVVELADGSKKLTFSELDTDNGPDLRVYLVAGPVARDSDVGDFKDLGGLKGNKGTQQYDIPAGIDTKRYSTVVIWCRAFTISFAKAELVSS
ncbi:MAG: DM13 domain-containing protein [Actinobacteria bacterium]|nr:DM13 domain-containing protein [Actinomycetota bacterium]